MPIINIQLISGRSPSQKRTLIKELAQATMQALGVSEQSVRVILTEVAPEHWGIGTQSKADIDGA